MGEDKCKTQTIWEKEMVQSFAIFQDVSDFRGSGATRSPSEVARVSGHE